MRRKLRRNQVVTYFAKLPPCRIGMEACGGAHHWARKLREMGHQVDLIPAQHVKPLVMGNKNDYNDARAIAEAGEDPLRGGQDPGPAGPAGGAADARAVNQGSNGVVS
jgi:transposase